MSESINNLSPSTLANLIADNLRESKDLLRKGQETNLYEKEILTRKEVASLLSICLVTIHEWVKIGLLKPYKLGNRTFFKRSEIMEALNKSNPSRS